MFQKGNKIRTQFETKNDINTDLKTEKRGVITLAKPCEKLSNSYTLKTK